MRPTYWPDKRNNALHGRAGFVLRATPIYLARRASRQSNRSSVKSKALEGLMRKATLVVLGLVAAPCILCGCLLMAVVASDFWRYGLPAVEAQHRETRRDRASGAGDAGASASAPSGTTQAVSDALARKHNCQACHGQGLRGQQLGALRAPDLTSSGIAGAWSEAQFIAAMRTGQRPDGSRISDAMPWRAIGKASDEELQQLWAYLRSLP